MASFADTTFENEARKVLNDKLRTLIEWVADGGPQTIEAYREAAGEIKGLKVALEACNEARRLIAGEEPHADALSRRRMATGSKGLV